MHLPGWSTLVTAHRRYLGFAALLALAVAVAGCDTFSGRSEGERLYRKLCAKCHGINGSGNTPHYMGNPSADLTDDAWEYGEDQVSIELVIREGIFAEMPANPDLTEAEMRALVEYLRSLRGAER